MKMLSATAVVVVLSVVAVIGLSAIGRVSRETPVSSSMIYPRLWNSAGTIYTHTQATQRSLIQVADDVTVTNAVAKLISYESLELDWMGLPALPEFPQAGPSDPVWLVGVETVNGSEEGLLPSPAFHTTATASAPLAPKPVLGVYFAWLANEGDLIVQGLLDDPGHASADQTMPLFLALPTEAIPIITATPEASPTP